MNKTELIASVAEKAGLSKKDSEKAVNAMLDTVTATLEAGEKVQLVGFGVLTSRCAAPAWAATPRPRKRSPFPSPAFLSSRPARL